MLLLMFLGMIAIGSAGCAFVLALTLSLFMPLRRALMFSAASVGSATVAGLAGFYIMALFVDDRLDRPAEASLYFGGIAAIALTTALVAAWVCAKLLKKSPTANP